MRPGLSGSPRVAALPIIFCVQWPGGRGGMRPCIGRVVMQRLPLDGFRIIRLNARINPGPPLEMALCQKYGLRAIPVEANTPEEIIPWVEDCDALFVVAATL